MTNPPADPTSSVTTSGQRLVSLDALRGFDMFWILGADGLVQALHGLSDAAPIRLLAAQLEHKAWHGFAFYDLIFPLFVFIMGVSLVFSLTRALATESRGRVVIRILRRGAILFLLGVFYNGGFAQAWPEVRLAGVLQRIAIAYAVVGILFCYFRPRVLAVVTVAILLGYWAVLAWTPIRDLALEPAALEQRLGVEHPSRADVAPLFATTTARTANRYDPGLNVPNHADFAWLPGAMYNRYYDPEGILSTVPAIGTCLLGVFGALWLRRSGVTDRRKVAGLIGAGVLAVALGWLWHPLFPVNKQLWTSSFVLVAGGWSLVLLGAFYFLVDVKQHRRWCTPFVWIGMNPITLYLATSVVSFHGIATRLAGGSIGAALDRHVAAGAGQLLITVTALGLIVALAGFLHRRRIFLKV